MHENDLYGNVEDNIGFLASSIESTHSTFTAGVALRTYLTDIRKLVNAMVQEAKGLPLKDSVRCKLDMYRYQLSDVLDQVQLLSYVSDRLNTDTKGTIDGKAKAVK
jgi:hypothetical protein